MVEDWRPASNPAFLRRWAASNDVRPVRPGHVCPRRLQGGKGTCGGGRACPMHNGGGFWRSNDYLDHPTVWARDGQVVCITGQPYHPPDPWLLRADEEEWGFDYCVAGYGWYHESAWLVELWRPGKAGDPLVGPSYWTEDARARADRACPGEQTKDEWVNEPDSIDEKDAREYALAAQASLMVYPRPQAIRNLSSWGLIDWPALRRGELQTTVVRIASAGIDVDLDPAIDVPDRSRPDPYWASLLRRP